MAAFQTHFGAQTLDRRDPFARAQFAQAIIKFGPQRAKSAHPVQKRRGRRSRHVDLAPQRNRRETARQPFFVQLARRQRPAHRGGMGNDYVGVGARCEQIFGLLADTERQDFLEQITRAVFGVHHAASERRVFLGWRQIGANRAKLQTQGFDFGAIFGRRSQNRFVTATLRFERDRQIRVNVAQRAERGE